MKTIGLIIAFKHTNYGAQLQAFATQRVIEMLGYDTKIIVCQEKNPLLTHTFGSGFLHHLINSFISKRKLKKTRLNISDEVYLNNRKFRKLASEQFIKNKLKGITYYNSYRKMTQEVQSMCAVLIGSDQMWPPGFCYRKIDSLDFVPVGVKKISYATSLGVSEYPKYCRKMSGKIWQRMDCLSVREKQGANIIQSICGDIPVEVVIDPTYLLSKQQWEEAIPNKKMSEKKYVFCYFLGNDDNSKQCARHFADINGWELVSVLSDESYSPYDQQYADKLVQGASPEDFINWIRGAEYIFTDSFHGLAFSVINEKQFYVFYRKRTDVKLNRNSRIDNILFLWQLEDRMLTDINLDWKTFKNNRIDYNYVTAKVQAEREHSLTFLKQTLP